MSRVLAGMAVVAMLAFGSALASEHADPQGNAMGHGCDSSSAEGNTPGEWFQNLKGSDKFEGSNPKEVSEHGDVSQTSPADLIHTYCGADDED